MTMAVQSPVSVRHPMPFAGYRLNSPVPSESTHEKPAPMAWMPGLARKGHVWQAQKLLFSGETKTAGNARANNSFVQYTPDNTPCPLATWHTFATSKAMAYHHKNAEILEKYIAGAGEYYQDISWIKSAKAVGEEPYTVFDTETTGLQNFDRIVQIAASHINKDHTVDHDSDYNTYVNPGKDSNGNPFPIKPGASEVHGITLEDVQDKPTMEELLHDFRNNKLKKNGLVVAYNAKFDIKYVNNAIERWDRSPMRKEHGFLRPLENALVLDPFVLIQRIHPFVSLRKRLGDHYEILMGRPLENKHDAQADVDGTVDVLKYCFKYLEKHTIPLKWAQFVDEKLPKKNWDPMEKAAIIARIVRENRPLLEAKMPEPAEPLRIIDVLRFQHGAPLFHDETKLPKMDISLNIFGWDGSKVWDKSDTLDPEVVTRVRNRRDLENRDYISDKFRNEFEGAHFKNFYWAIKAVVEDPQNKPISKLDKESPIPEQIYGAVEDLFLNRLFAKTLPRTDAEWPAFKGELETTLKTFVEKKLEGKTIEPSASTKIYGALPHVAEDFVANIKDIQKRFGDRYFYTYVPIGDKPLIDPAISSMDLDSPAKATPKTAKKKSA